MSLVTERKIISLLAILTSIFITISQKANANEIDLASLEKVIAIQQAKMRSSLDSVLEMKEEIEVLKEELQKEKESFQLKLDEQSEQLTLAIKNETNSLRSQINKSNSCGTYSNSGNIKTGSFVSVVASCPSGRVTKGGGCNPMRQTVYLSASYPNYNTYTCKAYNNGPSSSVIAYAICCG